MAFGIAHNVILPLRLVNEEIILMNLQNPFHVKHPFWYLWRVF